MKKSKGSVPQKYVKKPVLHLYLMFLLLSSIDTNSFRTENFHVDSKDAIGAKYQRIGLMNQGGDITAIAYTIYLPLIADGSLPPTNFNKHAPAKGSTGASLTPVLSWNTSARATKYEYCYDTSNDGTCNNWISTGTNTYAGLSGLQEGATYYWQVRAWNGTYGPTYANGSISAYWSFTTAILSPGAFNKHAPANGAIGVSLSPVLSWNTSARATKYEYCYDTTNDSACTNWISTGTNTYAGLSGLQEGTTYYWQARSWNGTYGPTYANGSSRAYWSFTTAILSPGAFNKHAPANGSTGASLTPVLSWNTSARATKYEYCYDTTNDGSCSNWISTGTNTYAGLSGLQEGTTYYWQVRSWNGTYGPTYANGSASAHWSFMTVVLQPGAFNKYAPANGIIGMILTPYLSWTASARATRYEYCYDTTNDGNCSNWVSTGVNRGVSLPTLQSSTTYYWQVRSWNVTYGPAYANGSSASFWSFRTLDPGVHVLDNCSMYATTNANVHLVCEIYNNTSSNIENVKLYIDIFNSLGGLVDTDYAYAPVDIVHIRGKACIDISFPRPSDPDFYVELGNLSWDDTSQSRPNLTLSNHSGNVGGSSYTVLGILTNNLYQTVYSVKAVDSLYFSSGRIVGCDYSFINKVPHDLSPGQSSSFEITTSLPDPSSVVRYTIQTKSSLLGTASEQATEGEEHIVSLSKIYHLMDLQSLMEEAENMVGERGLGE